jgi:hypothetical protein
MSRGDNAQLEGGRELSYINQRDAYAGSLFSRIVEAVNTLAKNAGVAAVGKVAPPHPIDAVNVQGTLSNGIRTCPSEILHWTLDHNQAVSKGVKYFSELDTSPSFTQPHVFEHGSSRTGPLISLPTYATAADKVAVTPTTYYLRSYAQYHGSDPCKPTVHGNLGGAIGIQMTGSSVTQLLPSTGSGTASSSGQQGAHGLGIVLDRPAPGPKRNIL